MENHNNPRGRLEDLRRAARPGARRWLGMLAVGLLVGCLGVSWAVSSAPGSAADDDFHLASIWCAWGREATGCHELADNGPTIQVQVDSLSRYASGCWLTHPNESARCIWLKEDGTYGEVPPRAWPDRANAGLYPSGFYSLLRLFVLPDSVASIVFVRLASFALCALLILTPMVLIGRSDRRRLLWYWLIAATPLGIWVGASSNPSGVAICAAASTFGAAFALARAPRTQLAWSAGALGALAVLIGDGARADAVWFCAIAVACGLLAGGWSVRPLSRWFPLVPILIAITLAIITGRRGGLAEEALPVSAPATTFGNLSNLASLYVGEWAVRLGWLDTWMPSAVWGGMALCFGGLVVLGLTRISRQRAVAISLAAAACVAVPMRVLMSTNQPVGQFVQPRYLLPLTMILAGTLAVRARGVPAGIGRAQAGVVAAVALVAHSLALHANLRRSLTGQDVPDWNLNHSIEWWWSVPVNPMTVWLFGSVSYAALILFLAWLVATEASTSRSHAQRRPRGESA